MAGLLKTIGKTRAGYWLWKRGRDLPVAGVLISAAVETLRAAERSLQRSRPAHRRHDAAARATLAAFEAETRVLQARGQTTDRRTTDTATGPRG